MKKRKILDTDVASDYLKNIPAAVEFIDGSEEGLVISAVSIA